MENGKRLEFRGGSFCALIPFVIFIVITISLSFFNAADLNMMIGVANELVARESTASFAQRHAQWGRAIRIVDVEL